MNAPDNTINSDVQKRRFVLLLYAGYGKRYTPENIGKNEFTWCL